MRLVSLTSQLEGSKVPVPAQCPRLQRLTIFDGGVPVAKIEKQAYMVKEVAGLMGLSRQTVTRLFEKEPGVLIVKRPETVRKGSYRSIRIPRAVYERVIRRISV